MPDLPDEDQGFLDVPGRSHAAADAGAFALSLQFFYRVPKARVWHALTEGINDWWSHRVHPEARSVLNATVGGQWVQLWSSGGALFATVSLVDVPNRLRLTGPLAMRRPATNILEFELVAAANGTELHVEHLCAGEIEPDAASVHEQGWNHLFGTVLAEYLVR
ncbi:MAG: SRPBCC domain-containing protein [Acidimicrobiales bacterium]|nr:SRPBCC domain-containing protein [Acidimicrobiales bacterium]